MKPESRCGRSPTVVRMTRFQDASTRGSFRDERSVAGGVDNFPAALPAAQPSSPSPSRAAPPLFNNVRRSMRLLRHRETRDPVAAERPAPEFFAHLHCNGTGAKRVGVGLPNQFLNFESARIDLYNVGCLLAGSGTTLTRGEKQAVGRPSYIVNAKTKRDGISLRWCLPARQAKKLLASQCSHIEPLTVFRYRNA